MADKTDTWMPLYVADYLKDTRHLSTMEHGAYLLLILHAWTHDGLIPLDEKRIARIAGMTPKEWRNSCDILLEFFTKKSDGFRHKRIEKERARASALNEQRREAGRASAAARAEKKAAPDANDRSNDRSTSVATESSTNAQRNSRPSQSHSTEEKNPPKPPSLPDDVRAVLEAGDFTSPPGDLGMMRQWYDAGADLNDLVTVIRREAASLKGRGHGAPRTLKIFDSAIREKLAADEAEIEHLRKVARRNSDEPQAAASQ